MFRNNSLYSSCNPWYCKTILALYNHCIYIKPRKGNSSAFTYSGTMRRLLVSLFCFLSFMVLVFWSGYDRLAIKSPVVLGVDTMAARRISLVMAAREELWRLRSGDNFVWGWWRILGLEWPIGHHCSFVARSVAEVIVFTVGGWHCHVEGKATGVFGVLCNSR